MQPTLDLPPIALDEDVQFFFSSTRGTAWTLADEDAAGADLELRVETQPGLLFSLGPNHDPARILEGDAYGAFVRVRGTLSELELALEGAFVVSEPNYSGQVDLEVTLDDLGGHGARVLAPILVAP